jgi:hypothetical protein
LLLLHQIQVGVQLLELQYNGGNTNLTEEDIIRILKENLKLKVEEHETNVMISIMLDDEEIASDYFMRSAK